MSKKEERQKNKVEPSKKREEREREGGKGKLREENKKSDREQSRETKGASSERALSIAEEQETYRDRQRVQRYTVHDRGKEEEGKKEKKKAQTREGRVKTQPINCALQCLLCDVPRTHTDSQRLDSGRPSSFSLTPPKRQSIHSFNHLSPSPIHRTHPLIILLH